MSVGYLRFRDFRKVKVECESPDRGIELTTSQTCWDGLIVWNPGLDNASEGATGALIRDISILMAAIYNNI